MALKETISWASGGLRFGSSGEVAQRVAGGDSLPMELGARLELLEQLRVLTYLVARPECVGPQRLGLQSVLGRHAWLPPLQQCSRRNSFAHLQLWAGMAVLEWRACISPKQLVLLDVGYVIDNVVPPYKGEKQVVFLAIMAVAWMVIWVTQNKGLYEGANISHRDLILYFRHQLRVKIRCDRKRLDCITFNKWWVYAASLVIQKGAMLESSFPPFPAHGDDGPGPLGPHPE